MHRARTRAVLGVRHSFVFTFTLWRLAPMHRARTRAVLGVRHSFVKPLFKSDLRRKIRY
jgi:hypothetical protein